MPGIKVIFRNVSVIVAKCDKELNLYGSDGNYITNIDELLHIENYNEDVVLEKLKSFFYGKNYRQIGMWLFDLDIFDDINDCTVNEISDIERAERLQKEWAEYCVTVGDYILKRKSRSDHMNLFELIKQSSDLKKIDIPGDYPNDYPSHQEFYKANNLTFEEYNKKSNLLYNKWTIDDIKRMDKEIAEAEKKLKYERFRQKRINECHVPLTKEQQESRDKWEKYCQEQEEKRQNGEYIDCFAQKYMEERLKIARMIYWPAMIFSMLFKGFWMVWVFGTIYYIYYKWKVRQEAIRGSH